MFEKWFANLSNKIFCAFARSQCLSYIQSLERCREDTTSVAGISQGLCWPDPRLATDAPPTLHCCAVAQGPADPSPLPLLPFLHDCVVLGQV